MYVSRSLILSAPLLVALAVGACSFSTDVDPGSADAWRISASVDRTTIHRQAGESVMLTRTVEYRGSRAIPVSSGCSAGFRVTDASGKTVSPGPIACAASCFTTTIQPGWKVVDHVFWGGVNPPTTYPSAPDLLPDGHYRIQALFGAIVGDGCAGRVVSLESEAFDVDLVP